jgi:hypothetical protein
MSDFNRETPPSLRLDIALTALRVAAERQIAARRLPSLRVGEDSEAERSSFLTSHPNSDKSPPSDALVAPFPSLPRSDDGDLSRTERLEIDGTESIEAAPAERTAFRRWAGSWFGRGP